jgi:antitoxin PrlF
MEEAPSVDSTARAKLRDKNQVTLPAEVREALHIREGDEIEFTITENGDIALRGYMRIPTDQRWFWTPEWQAGEREASEQIAAGETTYFDNDEDFLAYLKDGES